MFLRMEGQCVEDSSRVNQSQSLQRAHGEILGWSDCCKGQKECYVLVQQFHVAPAMPALKYTTSVDIQNKQKTRYKKLVTHVESHASAVSLLGI